MKKKDALKVCPFCGEKPILFNDFKPRYYVVCEGDCLVNPETPFYNEPIKAIYAWNKRAL